MPSGASGVPFIRWVYSQTSGNVRFEELSIYRSETNQLKNNSEITPFKSVTNV